MSSLRERVRVVRGQQATVLLLNLHPPREAGVGPERELRTLLFAFDRFLTGNLGAGMDILAQRFKAVEKCIVDHCWTNARWLDLIPTGEALLLPREEAPAAITEGRVEEMSRRSLGGSNLGTTGDRQTFHLQLRSNRWKFQEKETYQQCGGTGNERG